MWHGAALVWLYALADGLLVLLDHCRYRTIRQQTFVLPHDDSGCQHHHVAWLESFWSPTGLRDLWDASQAYSRVLSTGKRSLLSSGFTSSIPGSVSRNRGQHLLVQQLLPVLAEAGVPDGIICRNTGRRWLGAAAPVTTAMPR